MGVDYVLPVRNEERYITATLESVYRQMPERVIVVNDMSTDRTSDIAREMGAKVIDVSRHKYLRRSLRICETTNEGLRRCKGRYVAIVGGDVILSDNWASSLLERMDDRLVIASGCLDGKNTNRLMPMGTRLVDHRWWKENYNGGLYAEVLGWESLLVVYALSHGWLAQSFPDVHFSAQRRVGQNWNWRDNGEGMRNTGYNLLQVLKRCVETWRKYGSKAASDLLSSYLSCKSEAPKWALRYQRDMTLKGLLKLVPRV